MLGELLGEVAGWFIGEIVGEAIFEGLAWLVARIVKAFGVVLWWVLSLFAGWYAVEWWRQDPASSARMVVTLLGCLVLAAAGLAMTAARIGVARERKRILRGGV